MQKIQKPNGDEYAPYAIRYIDLVPQDGLVLQHLLDNLKSTQEFILAFPSEKLSMYWKGGNGPSKKYWFMSSIPSAFFVIGLCVLPGMMPRSCPGSSRMRMYLIAGRSGGQST